MGYSKTLQQKLDELAKLQKENRKLLHEIKASINNNGQLSATVKGDDLLFILNETRYKAIPGTGDDFEKQY